MYLVLPILLVIVIVLHLLKEYIFSVEQRTTSLELHRTYLMDRVRRLEECGDNQ